MNGIRRALALSTTAVLLAAAAVAYGQAQTSARTFNGKGAGNVQVGETFSSLYRARLIGKLSRGCEVAGPNARSALLRAPLKGSVDLSQTESRRVTNISLRGGATARGVGVGSTLTRVRAAFPRGRLNTTTRSVFGIDLYTVSKAAGGAFDFAIDVTRRVILIGIPRVAFCE